MKVPVCLLSFTLSVKADHPMDTWAGVRCGSVRDGVISLTFSNSPWFVEAVEDLLEGVPVEQLVVVTELCFLALRGGTGEGEDEETFE